MSHDSSAVEAILQDFPYKIQQVRGPNNELVWVEAGVNPDNVFDDKRRTDWPYSEVTADLICQRIAQGESLTEVCRQVGFPPYGVVCRWRVENWMFKQILSMAYKDRAEFYREQVVRIINEIGETTDLRKTKLKIELLKWCTEQDSGRINKLKQEPLKYALVIAE